MEDSIKTVYTTPASQNNFQSLSWSPDSHRVASLSTGAQFWDATTGDHQVTPQFPDDPNEWVHALDWSPRSRDVAVATRSRVLLVDGHTGSILRSYSPNASILSPTSDGSGYRSVTWSHDGRLIASALSFGRYGEVQVWESQTGALHFTLSAGPTEDISAPAWSSDGRYIAGITQDNTIPGTAKPPPTQVTVWDTSTQQIVLQSPALGPIAWQPQSHNLAFGNLPVPGGNSVPTLDICNVTTGHLVKQYLGGSYDALAWSPDGASLAYVGTMNTVVIIDVITDKQILVYKEHHQAVSVIAWSPNGQYIVSAENYELGGPPVAKVWIP